jgi:hypothetical protein
MNTPFAFERALLAPCGINCGTCIGYLRAKNRCCGCWPDSGKKPASCSRCIIKNCERLNQTDSRFCYDCDTFPCLRLKQLDKRYRTKYHMSMLQNLARIKEIGISDYLTNEVNRWSCPSCGSVISVHRENCLTCNVDLNKKSLK